MSQETITTIMNRRSIRSYRPGDIPEQDLRTILEAARQAPSANNRQAWHFVVVRDPRLKRRVGELCGSRLWFADVACVIVAIALPSVSQGWCVVDTVIALQNLVLAAASLGYGTCWMGVFKNYPGNEAAIKELLHIPENTQLVAITPLGLPNEAPPAKERKDWGELFSLNQFGTPLNG